MHRRRFLRTTAEAVAAGLAAPLIVRQTTPRPPGDLTEAFRNLLNSCAALAADRALPAGGSDAAGAADTAPPLLVVARGPSPATITRAAVDALGGMGRFVPRGARVVVKPNIGWDRTPEQAADTNPDVVAAIVQMALEAGAKSVLVMDNPCNDPRRCYERSGIAAAARAAGATVDFFEEARTRSMKLNGERLKEWAVHPAVIEADVRINVPIAKHHGLGGITLGMKNWMGAVGGNRGRMHQDLGACIVDLAAFFRPQLTVIDAVRVLLRSGPQGGSLGDVKRLDTVIASADPVAAETRGLDLHGRTLEEYPYIAQAAARGLGRSAWAAGEERAIELGRS